MPQFAGCCAHDHDCEAAECGPAWSLHSHIDTAHVRVLNEAESSSSASVFRAWDQRLERPATSLVSNDDDPELLVHVPFTGTVKIKAISVIGGTDGAAPSNLRVFVNREDLDFAAVADMPPVQAWELQENLRGDLEYPTQVTKFSGVHCLDLHIPANFGADATVIDFIGFKGDFSKAKREAVTAVYESRPLAKDHKVGGMNAAFHDVS